MENKKRWVIIRRIMKEVAVFFQAVTGKKKFLVKVQDGNHRDMSSC